MTSPYSLWYSPQQYKQALKRQRHYARRTTVTHIMGQCWVVVATVGILVMTLLSLLWAILLAYHGLVALVWNWRILTGVGVPW